MRVRPPPQPGTKPGQSSSQPCITHKWVLKTSILSFGGKTPLLSANTVWFGHFSPRELLLPLAGRVQLLVFTSTLGLKGHSCVCPCVPSFPWTGGLRGAAPTSCSPAWTVLAVGSCAVPWARRALPGQQATRVCPRGTALPSQRPRHPCPCLHLLAFSISW